MKRQSIQFKEISIILIAACGLVTSNTWGITPEVKISSTSIFYCEGSASSNLHSIPDGGLSSSSGVSMSTMDLSTDGGFAYRSGFYPSKWSGSLRKYALTLGLDGTPQMDKLPKWDAADVLTARSQHASDSATDGRKIYTSKIASDKLLETIEFKWDNLSSDQKAALNTSPIDGRKDGLGEKRLDYLRGTRSLEQAKTGGIFRTRDSVLGDIIGSNSIYVGAPALNGQGSAYQKFYETNRSRTSALYVGANDGMLHALNADTGRELFAYIPNILIPALIQLTRPNYIHRPYVDGPSTVTDAVVGGVWRTVLASGMGGGAQGIFALDVTNPSDFSGGAGALWEFTDADDSDMGNQMAAPVIAKFKMGTVKGKPEYKYFVVVSSGLNNYKADGKGKYDASASSAIFLLSLDKAPTEKWKPNVNYFKFIAPIKNAAVQNGLSAPALVTGSNGAVRYVYAGDLQGNLWRFDFTANAPWPHARSDDTPIFTASDGRGNMQPITTQPKIVFAPGGGYIALFGTGKFIEEADTLPTGFGAQSFYGVYDDTKNHDTAKERRQLEQRTLTTDFNGNFKIVGNDFSYGSTSEAKQGWYFDFQDSAHTGERSITNPVVTSGKLFFNTLLPAANRCGEVSGRGYAIDALTGLSPNGESLVYMPQTGLLGMPVIFQTKVEQIEKSPANENKAKKKQVVVNAGADGSMRTIAKSESGTNDLNNAGAISRRLGWREVQNWQELRNAANNK